MERPDVLDALELRSFAVLAEQRHFGRAAEILFVSQPALTKRLQRLEEKVGGTLLVRGRGEVRLTEPGRVLLERAKGLLREASLALQVSRQAVRGEAGLLRIGFGIASLAQLLPDVVLRFRRAFPNVQIQMQDMSSPAQRLALRRDEIDVGVIRMPVTDADIERSPILHERLMAGLGPGVSFREREGLASLKDEPFVICARSISASSHDHVLALCRRAGFAPKVVQETAEVFTQLQLARAGVGVALVPSGAASMRVPGVRLRDLRMAEAEWDIALAWKRQTPTAPLVSAFLDVARKVCGARKRRRAGHDRPLSAARRGPRSRVRPVPGNE
jgi:DNA-binding transcriptional LysR family regulator